MKSTIQVKFDIVDHKGSLVTALCLRQNCKMKSTYCPRCVRQHQKCAEQLKFLDEIPDALSQLQKTRDQLKDTFACITKYIAQLEWMVNENFSPINDYLSEPNLTNLNKIGQLLKDQQPLDVEELEEQKKQIFRDLDQFIDILFNNKSQQITSSIQQTKIVLSLENKNSAQQYYKEGNIFMFNGIQELFYFKMDTFWKQQKYLIKHQLLIRMTFIPGSGKVVIFNIQSLYDLGKFEEAINCYDKSIQIDPRKLQSYQCKGNALKQLDRFEEAIKCYHQQINIQPSLNCYIEKGNLLGMLSHFKDAEQCYIEGLDHFPGNKLLLESLNNVRNKLRY